MSKECPICRENIANLIYVTICAHQFYPKCLENWLKRNNTCPMCRKPQPQDKSEPAPITYSDLAWFREIQNQQLWW